MMLTTTKRRVSAYAHVCASVRTYPRKCVRVRVGASVHTYENVSVPQHVCIRDRGCARGRACAHVCARVRVFPHEHTCVHARGLATFHCHGRECAYSCML